MTGQMTSHLRFPSMMVLVMAGYHEYHLSVKGASYDAVYTVLVSISWLTITFQYQMYIMMLFNSSREDLSQIAIVLAPYKNDTWQTCVLIESY